MAGKPEESLWSNAKWILDWLVGTGKGRLWLVLMLAYGVVGPIVLSFILPAESEGGFWADFGRKFMESGPYGLGGILLAIFILVPLMKRRRRQKAAKRQSCDQ
ncbi:hypothetical protein [Arthrobacter sp. N1]|uniref:hypothetical protein n=1 Tax=Arthrobacter sp. N1 TaxID=619291 RepID=UPI003BAF3F24